MANNFPEATARELAPCPLGHYVHEGLRTYKTGPDPRIVCFDCGLTLRAPDWIQVYERWNTRTAVNSYDTLRAAAEAALKWIEGFRITKPVTVPKEVVCAQLRAALHPQPGEGK